ncbi:protein YIPF1-like isoform X1 [Daphnia carinata]|uniref:protein YIPF1-like isoform X1 n=1 Tax=Daphnia carinata TaxID=120202 RepID=UPI00257A5386|nr:protein YIPF1-like isoform X1 [Daphnia carinata]
MDFTNKANDAEALLQFQDFGMGSTSTAGKPPPYEQTHNFSNYPTSHVDIDEDQSQNATPMALTSQENAPSMLTFAYYQRYFDVDTPQVKERLMWSFIPRPSRDTLTHYIRPAPDLYGPLWICVTLVFCVAIMGNIADYLHSGGEGQHWRYDFRKVSISASTIFSYALLLPLVLWLLLWWRRKEGDQPSLGFIEIVSLYGYSLAIYIPISVLLTIPFPILQWTLVILGAALSGSVLVLSLWQPLSVTRRGMAVIILSAILAFHFLLAAGLQLYFFRYTDNVVIVSGNNDGISHGHLRAVDSLAFDKVTELQPLNFLRGIEKNSSSESTNAETTDPRSTRTLFHLSAVPLVTGIDGEEQTLIPERVAVTASYSVTKDATGHSEIPNISTKSSDRDGSTTGV